MSDINSSPTNLLQLVNSLPEELQRASMAGANSDWIAHKVKASNHYRKLHEIDIKSKMWKKISTIEIDSPLVLPGMPNIDYEKLSSLSEWAGIMEITEEKITFCLSEELKSAGVIFQDIASAFAEEQKILRKVLMVAEENSVDRMDLIAQGTSDHGFFLSAPAGLCIEKPFKVSVALSGSANYLALRLAIYLEENSNIKLILELKSDNSNDSHCLLPVSLNGTLGKNSQLELVEIQDLDQFCLFFPNETIEIGENAILNHFILDKGSRITQRKLVVNLKQNRGDGTITGVYLPKNRQTFLYDTLQNHFASDTTSSLLFKGVLDNSSNSLWKGNIIVSKGIHGADGYQLSNTLLLDPSAHAESIPGLEINTDDVKCSHGVTMSSVDKDQLFYLQSRGIGESDGKKLIVDGFIRSAISRIKNTTLQAYIQEKLDDAGMVF